MKILFITETFPFPLDSGGKIVTHQVLQTLSTKHTIHMIVLCSQPPTSNQLRHISSLGIRITIVASKKRGPWFKQSKTELINSMFQLKSFFITGFYEDAFVQKVADTLSQEIYDIIHIDHLSMAQYLPKTKNALWILHEHNIEYKLQKDICALPNVPIKERLFFLYNAITLARYEKSAWKRFDQIIVLSKQDKNELIKEGIPPAKVLYSPPGVMLKKQSVKTRAARKKLLFIGPLWWKPNLDAVNWLMKEILPLIHKKASLTIIGEGAEAWGERNHIGSSIHTIEKPKNITSFLARAHIFVAPFRAGEGVRIKILTAFAHNIPVVSTSIGVRGLEVSPKKEFLHANDAKLFADQVVKLLHDDKLFYYLTVNAAKYINKYHNSDTIKRNLLKSYGKTNH